MWLGRWERWSDRPGKNAIALENSKDKERWPKVLVWLAFANGSLLTTRLELRSGDRRGESDMGGQVNRSTRADGGAVKVFKSCLSVETSGRSCLPGSRPWGWFGGI